MKTDCPCMPLIALSPDHHVLVRVFPVAMAVTELLTGSVISQRGSLLYIFIAAECHPRRGFLVKMKYMILLVY